MSANSLKQENPIVYLEKVVNSQICRYNGFDQLVETDIYCAAVAFWQRPLYLTLYLIDK